VRYDPKSEAFTSYPLPKPPIGNTNIVAIRFSSDGDVWASEIVANQIVRLDPSTKEVRTYRAPSGVNTNASVNPAGIGVDGDQTVWFTEEKSNKIAKIDSKTGDITEYDVPTKGAVPRRMASDARGNLWFGEFAGLGNLATLDYRSTEIREFPTTTKYSGAYSVSVDTVHNLIWLSEMMADQIARFDPHTGAFVEYPIPTRNSLVRRIEVDPSRPSRVWFAGSNADTIGFLDVAN
jgi:virginiamycin B lyase